MITTAILENAQSYFHKTAIFFEDEVLTYKQLHDKIMLAKEIIDSFDLFQGEPVGICIGNSPEFLVMLLACELGKHPAVLLSVDFKESEMEYHIKNSRIRYIFTSHMCLSSERLGLNQIGEFENLLIYYSGNSIKNDLYQQGDFICQLTSGTDGKAKGVIRTSDAVLLEIEETIQVMKVTMEDCFLTLPPLCHSFGLIGGALLPLYLGCTLVLVKKFTPAKVAKEVNKQKVSVIFAVPFMYKMLVDSSYKQEGYYSSLKKCISAGALLAEEISGDFYDLTGIHIMQDYGSTETGIMSFNANPQNNVESVGSSVGSRQFKVVDTEGNTLIAKQMGRFLTKSKCNLRCYIYPDNANDNILDGWLCLGDIGYIDEKGELHVLGRESNMINVGGLKVDPVEIEKIIKELSAVDDVVVVGKPAIPFGEIVKAIVVRKGELSELDITLHCKGRIGNHKIPKIIEFVDSIPRSATGKIQRKYLTS